jgi:hypothetical protein
MPGSSLYGSFSIRGKARTEEERSNLRLSSTPYPRHDAALSYDASLLRKLDSRRGNSSITKSGHGFSDCSPSRGNHVGDTDVDFRMEDRGLRRLQINDYMGQGDEYFAGSGQKRRASSLPRHDDSPSLHKVGSASDLFRRRESVSRQSPVRGIYSGYAGSNHSSTSIRSYGSYDSYTCSVHSARGIRDADTDSRFSGLERRHSSVGNIASPGGLSPGGLSSRYSGDGIQDITRTEIQQLDGDHQTWEEFCDLQLVAFLQICTLDDVHALTQSPPSLRERFQLYLKRMISQEGNVDFLSYQASPRPGQPEAQLQLVRHHRSIFSQSRSSIRSHSSRTSHSSASTASSFSSQISDGTMLNHVQQEAISLKDCIIKIQKKLKYLEKESRGAQNNKGQEGPAPELASLRTLVETNETAIELLHSKEGALGVLGFCRSNAPWIPSKLLII